MGTGTLDTTFCFGLAENDCTFPRFSGGAGFPSLRSCSIWIKNLFPSSPASASRVCWLVVAGSQTPFWFCNILTWRINSLPLLQSWLVIHWGSSIGGALDLKPSYHLWDLASLVIFIFSLTSMSPYCPFISAYTLKYLHFLKLKKKYVILSFSPISTISYYSISCLPLPNFLKRMSVPIVCTSWPPNTPILSKVSSLLKKRFPAQCVSKARIFIRIPVYSTKSWVGDLAGSYSCEEFPLTVVQRDPGSSISEIPLFPTNSILVLLSKAELSLTYSRFSWCEIIYNEKSKREYEHTCCPEGKF